MSVNITCDRCGETITNAHTVQDAPIVIYQHDANEGFLVPCAELCIKCARDLNEWMKHAN